MRTIRFDRRDVRWLWCRSCTFLFRRHLCCKNTKNFIRESLTKYYVMNYNEWVQAFMWRVCCVLNKISVPLSSSIQLFKSSFPFFTTKGNVMSFSKRGFARNYCLNEWLTDWLTNWPSDRLTDSRPTGRLVCWLTDWPTGLLTYRTTDLAIKEVSSEEAGLVETLIN